MPVVLPACKAVVLPTYTCTAVVLPACSSYLVRPGWDVALEQGCLAVLEVLLELALNGHKLLQSELPK